VLHDREQHSTPTQHMAREEEVHVEQEAPEEEGFEDNGEEEEGAPQGEVSSSRLTTG
jgi:hypothetical protein